MQVEDILKLREGAYVQTIDGRKSMAVRLREGFTLTTVVPQHKLLIQRYSEHGNLLWEDLVDDVFTERRKGKGGIKHENSDC